MSETRLPPLGPRGVQDEVFVDADGVYPALRFPVTALKVVMYDVGTFDEGDDQQVEPDDGVARVDRLASLLRDVRRRLEHYSTLSAPSPADAAAWDADLYTYDDALVSVADLLDVEVPSGARDELTPEHRAELEADLVAAGIDLGGGWGS